jgi:hypothetical protein
MNSLRCLAVLAIAIFATGCSTLPTFRGPPPQLAKTVPAWPQDLNDYRGIIHCHSHLSHDSRGTFLEIQRACEAAGVDFLIMTDHITPDSIRQGLRGQHGRTLFLVGAEFSKGGGSVLGLDLRDYINRKLSTGNVVSAIHQQRGLAFVGHAEKFSDRHVSGFDGIELYNVHANAEMANKAWLATKAALVPAGTLFRSLIRLHPPNFARWDSICQQRRFVGIFGNDAHQNVHLFGPNAGTIGTYEQLFKVSTTHVIAPRLDRESVMTALRSGHCYGAIEVWGDTTGFSFVASDGARTVLMGDEMRFGPNVLLKVQLPVAAEIRVIHNGRQAFRTGQQTLSYQALWPGVYRVEAWRNGRPWICSNPIYLRE